MNKRERLADWISGGALTRARNERKEWQTGYMDRLSDLDAANVYAVRCGFALHDIIAMQTPGANATVRRMVRRAKEGLE